jgi:hypothetical protein
MCNFVMRYATLCALLLLRNAGASPNQPSDAEGRHILYVADQSRGILTIIFDPAKSASESLSILDTNTDGGFQPGWLTSRGDKLYSISRNQTAGVEHGGLFSFQKYVRTRSYGEIFGLRLKDRSQGKLNTNSFGLKLLSNESTDGKGGVYCDVNKHGTMGSATSMYNSSRYS